MYDKNQVSDRQRAIVKGSQLRVPTMQLGFAGPVEGLRPLANDVHHRVPDHRLVLQLQLSQHYNSKPSIKMLVS